MALPSVALEVNSLSGRPSASKSSAPRDHTRVKRVRVVLKWRSQEMPPRCSQRSDQAH